MKFSNAVLNIDKGITNNTLVQVDIVTKRLGENFVVIDLNFLTKWEIRTK